MLFSKSHMNAPGCILKTLSSIYLNTFKYAPDVLLCMSTKKVGKICRRRKFIFLDATKYLEHLTFYSKFYNSNTFHFQILLNSDIDRTTLWVDRWVPKLSVSTYSLHNEHNLYLISSIVNDKMLKVKMEFR